VRCANLLMKKRNSGGHKELLHCKKLSWSLKERQEGQVSRQGTDKGFYITKKDQLETTLKERVVAYFNTLSQNLLGGNERKYIVVYYSRSSQQ